MDSFFDFDTSLPSTAGTDNGRQASAAGHLICSEDEYDALNEETFGPDPDKGDWENMHESLVRLENGGNEMTGNGIFGTGRLGLFDDDELDLHFSKFDLTDGDESLCSSGADLSLDDDELCTRLRLDPSIWDSPLKQPVVPQTIPQTLVQNEMRRPPGFYLHAPRIPINMMSVEDIERNIIQQQRAEHLNKEKEQQRKLQQENRKNKQTRQHKHKSPGTVTTVIPPLLPSAQLLTTRSQMFPPPPLLNHQSRPPVGFLPYSFLPTHYPTPINNLAMHPGFPAGIGRPQLGFIPRIPLPTQSNISQNIQTNQFNRKLVQEIQQNHPLLSFHRQQNLHNLHSNNHKNHINQRYHFNNIPNGVSFDQHANMMTNSEKQWLIGIQLNQLNSDTPYINDYYFTVYKERLRAKSKESNANQAYQDNQLNHPFTQPRNHAQLLLMSSLARGGGSVPATHRDRKNSEPVAKNGTELQRDQHQHRSYTPLQFENSLGKLQCGSVKAPRKIIDMDVVGNESIPSRPPSSTGRDLSMHRKSRHVLLHIETLFKVVLKMEDLNNPVAIRAAAIAKEKREREQQQNNDGSSEEVEPECFDELLTVLMGGLTCDKVTLMLSVRKGKVLLRRICVLLRDDPIRWVLWGSIFSAIPFLLKKDRDDQDGVLFALYTEFERHVQYSGFPDLLNLSQVIATEQVLLYLASCKFLLSSIITIVFQMEVFFAKKSLAMATPSQINAWIQCLNLVMGTASKLLSGSRTVKPSAHHTIKIERENNIVQTIRAHLDRFSEHVKGNDFLDFITDGTPSGDNGNKPNAVADVK